MKKSILTLILGTVLTLSSFSLAGCSNTEPAVSESSVEAVESTAVESGAAESTQSETETVLAASEETETEGEIKEGGDFVFGLATEVYNYDPFDSATADARSIYFNIYDGLVKTTPEGDFEPAIAESYEISEDASVYTFHLRQGVKFHNGETVTADDVLYSIQRAIDTASSGYDKIESVEATDDQTVVVTLSEGNTDFLAYATQAIVPKDYTDLALNPIGTGPFKFEEYVEQDHVKLVKNEEYWGEPAHLDSVTVKFGTELVTYFQVGSIDGFGTNAGTAQQLDLENLTVYTTNSNAVQLLALNNDFEPFQDVRVRQAINYLVDADEIIDTVTYGYGVKIGSGLIPGLSKYFDESLVDVYDVNVEKAKELLEEAGYGDGFEFTIKVPSVYQVHIDTAQVILNELAAAGINASIEQVDWATWLENVYRNRQFEATIISLDGSPATPTAFLKRYASDASGNFINFKSEAYDEVYAKAIAATDDAERVELFKEAQKILSEEAASVFIQDISSVTIYNDEFDGIQSYPLYVNDFSAIYQK